MKQMIWMVLAVLYSFTLPAVGQSITFGFANGTVTGSNPRYYEFDITVYASQPGVKSGDITVLFDYNTSGFGSSISDNGKLTATLGTAFDTGFYFDPISNDNTTSRAAITLEYLLPGNETYATEIPTTPIVLFHIKIEISDPEQTAGLSFFPLDMQAVDYTGTNALNIIATDTDDHALPVELLTFEANIEPNGVRLVWITQSEIDNTGFFIYRSESANGDYKKINTALIPGAGHSTEPLEYSVIDDRVHSNRVYYYKLADVDINGESHWHGPISIHTADLDIPDEYRLDQNYPNPFNPTTTIQYALPETRHVRLTIFNTRGEKVRTLVNTSQAAGTYQIQWNGTDGQGILMPTGIYFYKLVAGDYEQIRKMLLTK